MPDASRLDDVAALKRVFDLRKRAAQQRRFAETSYFPADWLFSATKFDSQADIILPIINQEIRAANFEGGHHIRLVRVHMTITDNVLSSDAINSEPNRSKVLKHCLFYDREETAVVILHCNSTLTIAFDIKV